MDKNQRIILIIDDDKDLSMLIEDLLTDNGFGVMYADCIEAAYDILQCERPDLILLDINLPDGTGFELCEELRRTSKVPVIFASARTSEDDKVLGLDIGGDDYLAKPYSLKELMSRIKSLLRRTYGSVRIEGSLSVKAGPNTSIEIDKSCRSVKKNRTEISLSPKEYDLLLYFVENAGVSLSKETLLNEVWGSFSEVEISTVAVHVRWLREKLEENSSKPQFLKTVWGVGYMCDIWKEE